MGNELRWRQIPCLDIVVASIATLGAIAPIFDAAHGYWNTKDTLATGLLLSATFSFLQLRKRGYANHGTWPLYGLSTLVLIATVILIRRSSTVWIVGSTLLFLLGLIYRFRSISEVVSRRRTFSILCVASGALVSVAVSEVTLRMLPDLLSEGARAWILVKTGQDDWYVRHPYIGHLHNPRPSAKSERLRNWSIVGQSDLLGFRNKWPWPTQVDILTVGDSYTYGFRVEHEQAWPTLLGQRLNDIRVLNLGLLGGTPQQYLRIYETFGLSTKPKVLFVGLLLINDLWGAGEFERWLAEGARGAFIDVERKKPKPGRIWSIIRGVSPVYVSALVWDAYEKVRSYRTREVRTILQSNGNRLKVFPELLAEAEAYARPERLQFQATVQVLSRIHALAEQNGTRCLILFLPSKEEVYLPVAGRDPVDLPSRFFPELEKRGIPYLDLGPYFRRSAAAGETLYFEVDDHPNDRGHALIADVLITWLRQHIDDYKIRIERGRDH